MVIQAIILKKEAEDLRERCFLNTVYIQRMCSSTDRQQVIQLYEQIFRMLNRQVVKSRTATIKIPQLEFEIPPEAQRGSLSTVEGVLLRASEELQALQEERKKVDPETTEAIDKFTLRLKECATGNLSFTFIYRNICMNSRNSELLNRMGQLGQWSGGRQLPRVVLWNLLKLSFDILLQKSKVVFENLKFVVAAKEHVVGSFNIIRNVQICWAFSIYLEAVAILPQLVLLQRRGNIDNLTESENEIFEEVLRGKLDFS
uniref:Zinc finger ZPR1-type domain-containing protein n=1 Tax=Lactuca sativa TaxID=4236 RepID=A0A9R1UX78_LACSA|nr:hypothetical protein LSAT_V11C700366390 [Lactuca sativa]